eukprot:6534097-Lingulodinium_polyedra.AAC.1
MPPPRSSTRRPPPTESGTSAGCSFRRRTRRSQPSSPNVLPGSRKQSPGFPFAVCPLFGRTHQ